MKPSLLLAVGTALLLGGCSLVPETLLPDLPVASWWPGGPAYQEASEPAAQPSAAERGWRQVFRSPRLQQLIQQSLDNNRDLRVAALTIEKTRAQYQIQRAALLPQIDVDGSLARERVPLTGSGSSKTAVVSADSLSVGLTAYELDLFGRVHALEQQALDQYLATAEAADSTRIALVAEVASAYLTRLADRQLLHLTEETLATQESSYDLTKQRFEKGVATKLDLRQAQTSVETARANRALYQRQLAQDRNALELLVGAPLDGDETTPAEDLEELIAAVPAGLPADLLQRRPDIRQAEQTLKAADANIGAARAAFFPKITLTATAGLSSSSLSNLFTAGSNAWLFNPQIDLPIFDFGRRQASLDSARADQKIAVAQYEKAIQTAFREVSDALAARGTWGTQLTAQKALVEATADSYQLSQLRYQRGVDSYLNVLDSQRSLYAAQQTLISDQLAQMSNLVVLYKVLGGGLRAETGSVDLSQREETRQTP